MQIAPFPVGKQGEEPVLTPPARQRGLDLFTQLFNERFAPSPRVPVERKIFINLNEAAEYSGIPKSWLLQKIKQDELAAFKFRAGESGAQISINSKLKWAVRGDAGGTVLA